jgi:hypothetical protein
MGVARSTRVTRIENGRQTNRIHRDSSGAIVLWQIRFSSAIDSMMRRDVEPERLQSFRIHTEPVGVGDVVMKDCGIIP